jgi:hypothetical protein
VRKKLSQEFDPKRHQKQNELFMGFPGTFARSKSRLDRCRKIKLHMGPMDLKTKTQVDRDENGQSRQVQRQIPITPVFRSMTSPAAKNLRVVLRRPCRGSRMVAACLGRWREFFRRGPKRYQSMAIFFL